MCKQLDPGMYRVTGLGNGSFKVENTTGCSLSCQVPDSTAIEARISKGFYRGLFKMLATE